MKENITVENDYKHGGAIRQTNISPLSHPPYFTWQSTQSPNELAANLDF